MRIQEIYHKYKILPRLQIHHLRVASVAKLVALNSTSPVNIKDIVIACLLHDMGNIIKFNMDFDPDSFKPEGTKYWQSIKDEFIAKFGNDEHKATIMICNEIGVSEKVLDLINNMAFSQGKEILESKDLNKLICAYADKRVAPLGVLPLKDRVFEGVNRFNKNTNNLNIKKSIIERDYLLEFFTKIEKEIFSNSKIKPEDVNDESISTLMNNLIMQEDFVL